MQSYAAMLTALLLGCAARQPIPTVPVQPTRPDQSAISPQAQTASRECDDCENPHYAPPGKLFMHLRGSGKPRDYVGYHLFHHPERGFTLCPLYFEHRATDNPDRGYFGNCVNLGKLTHYRKEQAGRWHILFEDDLGERIICALRITCQIGPNQNPESYAQCVALPKLCTPLITSPWPKLEDWKPLPFDLF